MVLAEHDLTLFPDLNCYEKWSIKAKNLSLIADVAVSDLLESKATPEEKEQGLDLADYLIKLSHKDFIKTGAKSAPAHISIHQSIEHRKTKSTTDDNCPIFRGKPAHPEQLWAVDELESYFSDAVLPSGIIQLDPSMRIDNIVLFLETNLATVKANNGKRVCLHYFHRLGGAKKDNGGISILIKQAW